MPELSALSMFCHTVGCKSATVQGQKFCPDCRGRALERAHERFPAPPPGMKWIYFVRHGDESGPVKIGVAKSPKRRLKDLRVGNPGNVWIEAAFLADPAVEKALHASFADRHIRGEWFEPNPRLNKIIVAARAREVEQREQRLRDMLDSGVLA